MGFCKSCMSDCSVWGQLLIMASATAAAVMSALAAFSCEFTEFTLTLDPGENFVFGGQNITSGKLGLFRIELEGESCSKMTSDQRSDLDWQIKTGRIGMAVGAALGLVGLYILWMEFTCCRFKGGRCLEITLFLFATVGVGLSGLVYSSDFCTNPGEDLGSGPYPCDIEIGTGYAIAACCLYLGVCLILCIMPKPEPLCLRMKKEKDGEVCFVCCGKREEEKGAEFGDTSEDDGSKNGDEGKRTGFFFCWRREKKEDDQDEEKGNQAEGEENSQPSDYHESVAEPEEIPQAVMVTAAPMEVQKRVSQRQLSITEEEFQASETNSRSSWVPSNYFWPKPEQAVVRDPRDSVTQDLFFDAAGEEDDIASNQGNLTAEIY